jgi:predicted GNAT family acetyltransferase
MNTKVVHNADLHRYEIWLDDELAGFAEYRPSPGVLTFNHTEVDPIHRGKNLAAILMEATLKDVRDTFPNEKVVPTCSYVVRFMEKHPETQDLLRDPIEDALAACELRPRNS